MKNDRIQLLQNISGKNTNWELKDAFEVSRDYSYYINLGYLEYKGVDAKELKELQVDLLKDAPDGEVVFTTIDKSDYNLVAGDKIPLGSYAGNVSRKENLENTRLYLKLTYNADNKKSEEVFTIKGDYFEPFGSLK